MGETPYLGCYSDTGGDKQLHAILLEFIETSEYRFAVKYGWDEQARRFHYYGRDALITTIERFAKDRGMDYETGWMDTAAREAWVGWLEEATDWIRASYYDLRRQGV